MEELYKIFRTAVEYKASDIYITTGSKPLLRINGDLTEIAEHPVLTKESAEQYIFSIMNENQKKEFLGKLDEDFSIEIAGIARFRVNMFIQRKGIGAVFRLIPTGVYTMDELGLPEQLKKIPKFHSGIVLITGPTGSGKSTTLAAILDEINTHFSKHIITIEDPIEFVYDNKKSVIEQREVGLHTESFQAALRGSLRADTNVVLLGEMRDLETMSLAITAAETGHLVLTTLHTSGASKAVDRVIDGFPPEHQNQIRIQFSESLRAVVWQNLMKRKDGKGRVAGFEILFNDSAIANMIRKKKTFQIPSAIETGASLGMQTMKRSVLNLLQQGLISEEAAQANMPEEMIPE